jgi:hypothetical protein
VPDSICICNLRRKDKCKKGCDFSTNAPVDTLVPRFAAHLVWTRSNPWDEVFGRMPMNGIMATVLTSPSPSSTQGRVLHPTQNRMCPGLQGYLQANGECQYHPRLKEKLEDPDPGVQVTTVFIV